MNQDTDKNLPWFLTDKSAKEIYRSPKASFLVLDFEATTLDGGALNPDQELVLACWHIFRPGERRVTKEHFGDEFSMGELLADIKSVNFIVAQNAKYELQWLKRCGAELRDILVWDTMLAAWVLDGNQRMPRNLSALAERYGYPGKQDLISTLWETGVDTRDIPRDWLSDYCHHDVMLTYLVFRKQLEQVYSLGLQHLVLVRNLTCACLADIEFNGMTLDKERVQQEYERVIERHTETQDVLREISGGINLNSPKQLGQFLFETLGFDVPRDRRGKEIRTDKGAYKTNSEVIGKLVASTDEQRRFLSAYSEYNKLDSLLTKNLDFFVNVCKERGGAFQALFNQAVAQTHRLSSSGLPILFKGRKEKKGVQFQNLPREYKRLFWSGDEEYLIGEADGAQLEFRVATDLCRDPTGWEAIATGEDVHSDTARVMTESGEPTSRQEAKPHTFKPLYGGQSGTPAQVAYYEFFKRKYDQIAETQRNWALKVVDKKHLRTPYGMIFYWPDTRMDRSGYITNTTNIYNYPVQGFATGEIIPIALVHFWHRTRDTRVVILNTIHDSIVAKVHRDDVEWYKEVSRLALTDDVFRFLTDVYNYEFVTPLGAGVKVSRNWGDTKQETTYNVFPDGTIKTKVKE